MLRRAERTLLSGKGEEERTSKEAAAVRALPLPPSRRTAFLATGLLLPLALEPALIARLPRADAWGDPIRYESWKANDASPVPDRSLIASPGTDGARQVDPRTVAPGPTRGTKADIVIRDGELVSYPEGAGFPTTR